MSLGPARAVAPIVVAQAVGASIAKAAPVPVEKPTTAAPALPENRFAELLRRNRAETATQEAPAPAQAPPAASGDDIDTGDTRAIEAKAAPANAAKARAAAPKVAAGKAAGDDGERGDEDSDALPAGDSLAESDRSEPATTALPPDRLDPRPLAQAALDTLRRLACASAARVDDANGSTADGVDAGSTAGTGTTDRPGQARGTASADAASERHASAIETGRDTALRIAADARFAAPPGETLAAREPPAATPGHARGADAPAASLGVVATSLGAAPAGAPTPSTELALPTPIDAPDFAAALGVRVSMLVRDGVQQAELHLNPAETGPVSIHITLDGTAARVDFGADLAATRAAIERGLPELASALRDAGFTLAGGGVSQHAGGRARGDDETARSAPGPGGGSPSAAPSAGAESRRVVRRLAAGGVDLYA